MTIFWYYFQYFTIFNFLLFGTGPCNHSWHGTPYVVEAVLCLTDLPDSASQALGLQVYATMAGILYLKNSISFSLYSSMI